MTANKRRDDPWDVRWERLRAEAEQLPDGKKVRWLLAAIRTMIEKGELRHGEKLPSQAQFKDHYKMSPTTSREAYGRLIGLGRVRTSQGQLRNVYMPTKRRHRLIVRTRESAGHQEPVGQQDSVSEQLRVAASPILPVIAFLPVDGAGPVTARWEDGAYAVPEWDAEALGIDAGTELLTRSRVVSVGDERVLASISLVPADILGPAVRWSNAQIGELALAGVSTTFDSPEVQTRIPTLVEEEMLGMVAVAPVFAVYRPCRIRVEGGTQEWPGCVVVIARGDRVSLPPPQI